MWPHENNTIRVHFSVVTDGDVACCSCTRACLQSSANQTQIAAWASTSTRLQFNVDCTTKSLLDHERRVLSSLLCAQFVMLLFVGYTLQQMHSVTPCTIAKRQACMRRINLTNKEIYIKADWKHKCDIENWGHNISTCDTMKPAVE